MYNSTSNKIECVLTLFKQPDPKTFPNFGDIKNRLRLEVIESLMLKYNTFLILNT